MSDGFKEIAGIRLMAQQSLIQILYRSWGKPPQELMTNLVRSREAVTSSMLQQRTSDEQIDWVQKEFDIAITSLQALIDERPDTRPDPI